MVRDFRIEILKYLRDKDATTTVVDLKTPFMLELATPGRRKDFKKALDTLATEKLIVVTGSYDFLNWKLLDSVYPIDDKIIEGRITAKGMAYEHAPEKVTKVAEAEPLDLPLPAPVEALGRLFKGTKTINEEQLKKKMKKLGATDAHLVLKYEEAEEDPIYHHTPHVSAVPNPLTQIADDLVAISEEEPLEPEKPAEGVEAISTISLKKPGSKAKPSKVNTVLKWAVIVVMIILVVLIAKVFKDNG